MERRVIAIATLMLLLAGCAAEGSDPWLGVDQDSSEEFLIDHGLAGMDAVQAIDHLDQLAVAERPNDLMASVYPDELVLAGGAQEVTLDLPAGTAYVSIAPYVNTTHECFYHSLTTCRGELDNEVLDVRIIDEFGGIVVDEQVTTFDNGFVGFWVPKGIEGTIEVSYDGKFGSAKLSTTDEGATCITDLQLV